MNIPFLGKLFNGGKHHNPDDRRLSTVAGVGSALVVIVLFILAATYLRYLVFGFILAYFFLPLEQFFEHCVFPSAPVRGVDRFFQILTFPLKRIRETLSGQTRQENEREKADRLTLKATLATFLSISGGLLLLFSSLVYWGAPAAMKTGDELKKWASSSPAVQEVEKWILPNTASAAGRDASLKREDKKVHEKDLPETIGEILLRMRPQIRSYLESHQSSIALFAVGKGKSVVSVLISILSFLGTVAFDLLLSMFFFVYFLQKLAACVRSGKSPGTWMIDTIYSSPWLPKTGEAVRDEASGIINHLCEMFGKWVRGYLTIIFIEWILYMTLFSVFKVPYALPLGIVAGMTILLPYVGLMGSIALTTAVCLGFTDGSLVYTLAGVGITYLLVNGICEQLILYPSLVGGAIGLSTLETILVVLIGASVAGVSGMILAVPAAAVLKYLIPKIYRMRLSDSSSRSGMKTENGDSAL